MDRLPNEALLDVLKFLSLISLARHVSIVSRRFAAIICDLILFPINAKEEDKKKIWTKKNTSIKFYLSKKTYPTKLVAEKITLFAHPYYHDRSIIIPIPETSPPPGWKLGVGEMHFFNSIHSGAINSDDVQLRQFFKFLADSGEMEDCAIFLDVCASMCQFNLDSGYVSPLIGQVVQFEMKQFVVDDNCYASHGYRAPFSQQFFLEVPQLIVDLDNLVLCEREVDMCSDPCRCLNLVEWLGTPLPMPNSNSSSIYVPARKLNIDSWNLNNVVAMVGMITLNFLHSTSRCPFDVFVDFHGSDDVFDLEAILPTQPNVHQVTGEALQIRQLNGSKEKKQSFVIRRCPAEEIGEDGEWYITERSCLLHFN